MLTCFCKYVTIQKNKYFVTGGQCAAAHGGRKQMLADRLSDKVSSALGITLFAFFRVFLLYGDYYEKHKGYAGPASRG